MFATCHDPLRLAPRHLADDCFYSPLFRIAPPSLARADGRG